MLALFVIGSYLIASIPFGLLIARARGVDIRACGSGNIGATNVGRILGRKWGLLVLMLDALKGATPVVLAGWLTRRHPAFVPFDGPMVVDWTLLAVAIACLAGSVAPILAGFRGGKAVATSLGIVLAIPPLWEAVAVALVCYLVARKLSGFVSVGSLVAATVLPLACLLLWRIGRFDMTRHAPLMLLVLTLTAIVFIRHRANVARLLAGTEPQPPAADDPAVRSNAVGTESPRESGHSGASAR